MYLEKYFLFCTARYMLYTRSDFRLFSDILPVIVHVITELFIFVNDYIDAALSLNISHPDIQ